MKGLIVGSGNLGSGELLKSQSLRADKIICADGGIRYFKQSQIIPDLVIGDLDSATEDEVAWIYEKAISIEQYPMEKDATDMELCIKYLVNNGYNDIVILGGIGTRLDHTLANLFTVQKFVEYGVKIKMADDINEYFVVDKGMSIPKKENQFCSIIPMNSTEVIVTLKGFHYNLNGRVLKFGETMGVSNYVEENFGHIIVEKGICAVILSYNV